MLENELIDLIKDIRQKKCESNSIEGFSRIVEEARQADTIDLGEKAYRYLQDNYTVEKGYSVIQRRLK